MLSPTLVSQPSAHQVLVVVVPSLVISSSCARHCVFMTRDMLCIMAQENSCVHLVPRASKGSPLPPETAQKIVFSEMLEEIAKQEAQKNRF